jgi:tRNA/tmRNA/rRNA uracil-C5-methylase (TrmA/RlmC/RlmD family)
MNGFLHLLYLLASVYIYVEFFYYCTYSFSVTIEIVLKITIMRYTVLVLELYGGVGTIGLHVADLVTR